MPKLENVELVCTKFEMKKLKILFDSAKNLKVLRFWGMQDRWNFDTEKVQDYENL